jgi:hypothetical protein
MWKFRENWGIWWKSKRIFHWALGGVGVDGSWEDREEGDFRWKIL